MSRSPHQYSEYDLILHQLLSKRLEFEFIKERYEDDLWTAMMAAEAASRAKSEFLANMSHELRTPLNAILGFSEMMLKGMAGELKEKQTEYIGDIYESGDLLLSLINDILDLSKVEAGKMGIEYMEVDVRELINRSLMLFKEKMLKHGLRLTSEVEAEIGAVEADGRRLKQVLVNLLSNAVKFTPDGGSVLVTARRVRGEEEKVSEPENIEISVEDTGPGIKTEDYPKLFKPFQQLESTYDKKHQGTGLGLVLCKKIVEMHGGKIWVESEWGRGSKFTFRIPVRRIED